MSHLSQTLERTESQPLLHKRTPDSARVSDASWLQRTRASARHFLQSRAGHYAVLLLVTIDVSMIFADFILTLYVCEHTCKNPKANPEPDPVPDPVPSHTISDIRRAQDVLGVISLVFSYLFMVELLLSVAAFGWGYFRSKFHCFDAFVIVAGFVVDVGLAGVLEEIGSIVVVLRLWRVIKIIEELSSEAMERIDAVQEELERDKKEKQGLQSRIAELRRRGVNVDLDAGGM